MSPEEEEVLFQLLRNYADIYNWELTKRDPGPESDSWPYDPWRHDGVAGAPPPHAPTPAQKWCACGLVMINADWCSGGHFQDDPKADWTEDQIRASTRSLKSFNDELIAGAIEDATWD